MTGTGTTTSLPSPPSPVTPMTQARVGTGAWVIAIAACPGRLGWSRCCPCRWQWRQGHPLPPRPCCRCPLPPPHQSPLPSFPGCCSPPRWMCPDPPCRQSPCGHTSSSNCRSNSALALLHSALAKCHCSCYPPGPWGARAMPPHCGASCAGRWSSWPN
jgi:hypothetical protein